MNFLEERIQKDGIVKAGNVLKVDSFLNHQMDIALMEEIGREFKRRFGQRCPRSQKHCQQLNRPCERSNRFFRNGVIEL